MNKRMYLALILWLSTLLWVPGSIAEPRLVAIGDAHGDFQQFVDLLKSANLLDRRNRWSGEDAILVQLGDLPDRGPDTRKIMDLLIKLEKAAARKGGQVVTLIGNHDAMNMYNDLRYVHPGEYEAFKDRQSPSRQDQYYESTLAHLKQTLPEEQWPVFDQAHRMQWEKSFPLGYVAHRLAWAPGGKYGKWVLTRNAVHVAADSLFVHGGLSESISALSVTEINNRIRMELNNSSLPENALTNDPQGPLWYRGWARLPESAENHRMLDQILQRYGVKRMVIAHTPLTPVVLPRFDGKILMVDVGLSAVYGGGRGLLEIVDQQPYSLLDGQRTAIPTDTELPNIESYLQAHSDLLHETGQQKIRTFLHKLKNPPTPAPTSTPVTSGDTN